jgi:hypothetical protein
MLQHHNAVHIQHRGQAAVTHTENMETEALMVQGFTTQVQVNNEVTGTRKHKAGNTCTHRAHRWAMTIVVRDPRLSPVSNASSARCTCRSLSLSRALVASSSNRILGLRIKALHGTTNGERGTQDRVTADHNDPGSNRSSLPSDGDALLLATCSKQKHA